jgi:hypothetical protein
MELAPPKKINQFTRHKGRREYQAADLQQKLLAIALILTLLQYVFGA